MDPRSEVLLRQAELFHGSVLLAGLPADDLMGRLPEAHGWCWHAGDQAALDARFDGRSHFGVNAPERGFDSAVVFLPKAKDLTDYILNALASKLAGRELYLVGEKRSGIEGAAKQLNPFGKPRVQGRLIAGVPAPAMGIGQTTQQVVGRQAGQQHRALE